MHDLRHHVFIFRHAAGAAVKDVGEILLAQGVKRVFNFTFVERRDRISIVLLITGGNERIDRQWIILWRRDLLFDQRTEDPDFDWIQIRHARDYTRSAEGAPTSLSAVREHPCSPLFFRLRPARMPTTRTQGCVRSLLNPLLSSGNLVNLTL